MGKFKKIINEFWKKQKVSGVPQKCHRAGTTAARTAEDSRDLTSRGHSRITIRHGRPSDDSAAALANSDPSARPTDNSDTLDSTAAPRTTIRQPVRLRTPSVTLCRKAHSDNSNEQLLWLLSFTTNISHSTTRAQFQYTSARLLTLIDSQTI